MESMAWVCTTVLLKIMTSQRTHWPPNTSFAGPLQLSPCWEPTLHWGWGRTQGFCREPRPQEDNLLSTSPVISGECAEWAEVRVIKWVKLPLPKCANLALATPKAGSFSARTPFPAPCNSTKAALETWVQGLKANLPVAVWDCSWMGRRVKRGTLIVC